MAMNRDVLKHFAFVFPKIYRGRFPDRPQYSEITEELIE